MGWLEVKKNLFGKIFLFLLIAIISGHTSNAVVTDYAAGTFTMVGSFDSWAKCSETGYGSDTDGDYMYKSITPAASGGLYDVYVYADMDNNLCSSSDFYLDDVLVNAEVNEYSASSSCEARKVLDDVPLSSSAHTFKLVGKVIGGCYMELVHLSIDSGQGGETCGAGQYAYGGSCTNVGANYYSPTSDNDRTACPSNSDTNGATTSDAVDDCLGNAGYYNCQTGTCSAAGDDYWSADNSNSRTQCAANSGTNGATTSSAATDCNCDAGYYDSDGGTQDCTAVGDGYYSATNSDSRTQCPTNSDTAGATTSDAVTDCVGNAGYYNCEDGTCDAAGDDYWSADNSNSRTQCTANSGTGGATTSSAATDCNCDLDYYDSDGGSQDCTAVGTGYYSATNSDSRTACTNSAANSDYTGSGGGSNNCPWGCIADLDESTNCTVCNNTAAIFTNNILQYSALGINSACTLFLDNSTLEIGTFSISGTGDRVFIGSKSKITIL